MANNPASSGGQPGAARVAGPEPSPPRGGAGDMTCWGGGARRPAAHLARRPCTSASRLPTDRPASVVRNMVVHVPTLVVLFHGDVGPHTRPVVVLSATTACNAVAPRPLYGPPTGSVPAGAETLVHVAPPSAVLWAGAAAGRRVRGRVVDAPAAQSVRLLGARCGPCHARWPRVRPRPRGPPCMHLRRCRRRPAPAHNDPAAPLHADGHIVVKPRQAFAVRERTSRRGPGAGDGACTQRGAGGAPRPRRGLARRVDVRCGGGGSGGIKRGLGREPQARARA